MISRMILWIVLFSFVRLIVNHLRDIIEEASHSVPLISLIIIADGVRASTDGVIRGCGRQAVGAVILFVSYYLIGMTTGIPLMLLTSLRLSGFWIGALMGATTSLIISVIFLKCLNWEAEGLKAQKRVLMEDRVALPNEKTSLIPKEKPRRRYPREPRSCSTNFEVLSNNAVISDSEFRRLIILRLLIMLGCLAFFFLSLALKLTVFSEIIDGMTLRNGTNLLLPVANSSSISETGIL